MKRPLKFRAFYNGEMIHKISLTEQGKYAHCISEGFARQYDPEYVLLDVMQYTGQKDKEGKELYEGDIVKGCCFNGAYALGQIIPSSTGWVVNPIGMFLEGYDDIDTIGIEIIGNVWENSELLKQ